MSNLISKLETILIGVNCSAKDYYVVRRDVQIAGIPIPEDLIPIPRERPFPGNKHFLPENFPFPFPVYSRGIRLIPREFPIPKLFPGNNVNLENFRFPGNSHFFSEIFL